MHDLPWIVCDSSVLGMHAYICFGSRPAQHSCVLVQALQVLAEIKMHLTLTRSLVKACCKVLLTVKLTVNLSLGDLSEQGSLTHAAPCFIVSFISRAVNEFSSRQINFADFNAVCSSLINPSRQPTATTFLREKKRFRRFLP